MSEENVELVPELVDDSGGDDDYEEDDNKMDEWIGGDDDEFCQVTASCLFCDFKCQSSSEIFEHCNEIHDFNIINAKKIHNLDCYSYIKLINYIRLKKPAMEDLKKIYPYNTHPWSDDVYLKSTLNDDPLLYFDIESSLEKSLPQSSLVYNASLNNNNNNGNKELVHSKESDNMITLSIEAYNTLLNDLHSANEKVGLYRGQLEAAIGDLNSVRSTVRSLSQLDVAKGRKKPHSLSEASKSAASQSRSAGISSTYVGDNPSKDVETDEDNKEEEDDGGYSRENDDGDDDQYSHTDDDYYFESYDHYSIHEEMLKDKVRTQSYKDAMIMNPSSFAKKVVIDLGCGTSILSMFAVQAGAELVYAIDQSEIIYTAMDIVRENGLEKKIKCIKSKIEEAKLPCKKVDIIVSEWMGYFLLFESMLESVIYCRDNFLAPGGLVLPSHCNIFLGAFDSSKYWRNRVKYWDDVYGFKMSCIKTAIITEVDVDVLGAESVLTDICCIKKLDIMTVQSADLDFDSSFRLLALRDGVIHGFFGFFDTVFDLKNRVEFSTGPFEPETHWKQSIFLLAQPIPVCKGQHIDGRIYVKRSKKDHRSLDVNIIIGNKKHKYFMN